MTYGVGADVMGTLGGIVGWPMFISTAIITGNLWGFLSGEWKGVSRGALVYCLTGIGILFIAIGVIGMGNAS
jgi:L-rhamnose-H+ transport protein